MCPEGSDAFPATRHSVVRAISSGDVQARERALETIVRAYWRPVYTYIRLRWHREPPDAQDLTQEFFARALEKQYLARFDPAKGRFRTFLRTCVDGFVANDLKAASRAKRGGGATIESLDFEAAERELSHASRSPESDPEIWFQREWIRGMFAECVGRFGDECRRAGRQHALTIFARYDLEGADAHDRPTYAALATELDLSTNDVTNQLAWARRTFRELVLATLRELCATDEEYRSEARALLGVDPLKSR